MPSCAIKWCGKCSKTSNFTKDGITFHKHFTPECFENLKNNKHRLYSSSVPTLYLPHLVPSVSLESQILSSSIEINKNESSENMCLGEQNEKRKMRRHIDNLILNLNKKKKEVKSLQDKNRTLNNKVANLQKKIDELTKNALVSEEKLNLKNNDPAPTI